MRGEDTVQTVAEPKYPGSPPHARGRPFRAGAHGESAGITPACAGKTVLYKPGASGQWDHPRMRGEDSIPTQETCRSRGSPPHARGRPEERRREHPLGPDHPRMRGEDADTMADTTGSNGSPPHARGRPRSTHSHVRPSGITPACAGKTRSARKRRADRRITPACAGKTPPLHPQTRPEKDHPRMRGEDHDECGL